jgi:chromosome segregation ATPase
MAINNSPLAYHKIKSLEVKGGFLDGMKIEFDDNLNCLIGGRGTGKTTVIEFIRYALGKMPDRQLSSSQYRSIDRLIRNNLGSGRLRLEIETLNGLSYTIERTLDEEMLIFDEKGNPTNISLDKGILFNAEIYSQNEIEDIANDPYFQLKLIDKFIAEEITEIEKDITVTTRALDQNAIEILQLHKDIDTLEEQLSELPNIREKLKAFKIEEGEGAKEIQKEGELKAIRDKEEQCIKDIANFFNETITELKNLNDSLSWQLDECFVEEIFQGENKDIFEKLQKESGARIKVVSQKLEEALEALGTMEEVLQDNKEELITRHAKQEKRYRDLLQEYEKEKDKARERDQLIKKQAYLEAQQKKLDKKKKELKEKNSQRRELIGKLSELRDKRYNKRTEVASQINSKLSPTIRVRIEQFGNTDKYYNILTESMRGAGLKFGRIVEKTVERIPPQT